MKSVLKFLWEISKQQRRTGPLFVCDGTGPAILGRSWYSSLGFKLIHESDLSRQAMLSSVCQVGSKSGSPGKVTAENLDKRAHYLNFACFQNKLGTYNRGKVHLALKPDARPIFLKARPVPFLRQKLVLQKLDELEQLGIITPIAYSPWATPLVIVPEQNHPDEFGADDIRICGDYRSTNNEQLEIEQFPLKTPDQLFAKLDGQTWFSRFHLKLAYAQLEVTEESAVMMTINTINGLYKVNRLAFGIASAPAIFTRVLNEELKDLPCVVMFLDDVLVMGSTEAELMKREEALLERLSNLGFALNVAKSRFGEREIRYLGFWVSGGGISPLPERVEALHNAPPPTNVTELKSILGHLTFYDGFCKNGASVAAPLYELLNKQVPFVWGEAQQRAFQET